MAEVPLEEEFRGAVYKPVRRDRAQAQVRAERCWHFVSGTGSRSSREQRQFLNRTQSGFRTFLSEDIDIGIRIPIG
jgi:hypothetical protein